MCAGLRSTTYNTAILSDSKPEPRPQMARFIPALNAAS